MSRKLRSKRTASAAGKGLIKHERTMTNKESSDLIESARQALAIVQGAKLIGARINVQQVPVNRRRETRKT